MYKWSLDDLYTSFTSPEYQADFKRLDSLLKEMQEYQLVDTLEGVKGAINLVEEYNELLSRLSAFINLTLTTNTSDPVANNDMSLLSQKNANFQKELARFRKFFGTTQVDLSQDPTLAGYTFLFEEASKEVSHILSDDVEEVIAKLTVSAGDAWEQLQSYLTSTVETDFKDQKTTLSEIRNLAFDADPQVRKDAFLAELDMYQTIKEPIAFALNNIKSQVNTVCELRDFESGLDQALHHSRMKKETLDALLSAMQDSLPAFRRYLKHKASLLGHSNGLPFYDLFAPMGQSNRRFTIEESKDFLLENFSTFSKDLADMTEEFYDKSYIDFLPHKGKVGGAFCWNLPFIKQSRILTNFSGSLSDVVTLAHELGHAYHGLHIENHQILNRDYSMPVAETASTFNENIIMNTAIKEADDAEKIALIESQLQDTTQIIVDIYSRYLFESAVFEKRQSGFLFADQLETMMLDAQKEAYGDGLDPEYLHPYMWVNKGHYYSAHLSFYNFPYAFGGLFSKGLYAIYQENPQGFVEKYQELLYMTTVSSVEDTAKVMGIDLTKKEFWSKALGQVEESIDQFIALTSK
ncbi:M3 family oligoendopeptidase [Granulicatella seriolae]|uniref:M3 family oligoendopeptidase n=1 Tax=Granulicatella seriolae TaxID=2967226 RepID=A0ABT1WQ49_9LACT|nr:M3 family oligoendopeptidase [Granulicatella seriolae]